MRSHRLDTLARHGERYTGNFGNSRQSLASPTMPRHPQATGANERPSGRSQNNQDHSRHRQTMPDNTVLARSGNSANPIAVDQAESLPSAFGEQTHRSRAPVAHRAIHIPADSHYPRHHDSIGRSARDPTHILDAHQVRRSRNQTVPRHPFQLDNTLAQVNDSYNNRIHAPMMERYLAPSQPSSDSESSDITIMRGRDSRRKRALSIDSDAAVDGEGIWDHE